MGRTLKDSFRFNRYSTYRQEKDRESNCNLCPFFLTSTASVFTDAIFIWRYVCYRKRDIFSLTLKCDITSLAVGCDMI